jgi:hypothetical protein
VAHPKFVGQKATTRVERWLREVENLSDIEEMV